jgi:hypothetical protein
LDDELTEVRVPLNLFSGKVFPLQVLPSKGKEAKEGGVMSGAMLNEQSIALLLNDLCNHLRAGNTEQADMTLRVLDFGRLLHRKRSQEATPSSLRRSRRAV